MSKREFFTDRTGKWVGSVVSENNGTKVYYNSNGSLAGRVSDNKTYDKTGKFYGNGNQGINLFGK